MKRLLALLLVAGCGPHGRVVGVRFVPAHWQATTRCVPGYGYGFGYSGKWGFQLLPCASQAPDSVYVRDQWHVTVLDGEKLKNTYSNTKVAVGDSL